MSLLNIIDWELWLVFVCVAIHMLSECVILVLLFPLPQIHGPSSSWLLKQLVKAKTLAIWVLKLAFCVTLYQKILSWQLLLQDVDGERWNRCRFCTVPGWCRVRSYMFYCILGTSEPVAGNKLWSYPTLGTPFLFRAPSVRLDAIVMKKQQWLRGNKLGDDIYSPR